MPKIKQTEKSAIAGRKIRDARRAQEITQKQLALALNITFQQLQKYERGVDTISIDKLFEMCGLLHISAADIIKKIEDGSHESGLPQNLIDNIIKIHFNLLMKEANKVNQLINERHAE